MLSGGKPGPHKIQGIGAGFVPAILNSKIDEVIQVSDENASMARRVEREEGILVGISSAPRSGLRWKLPNARKTKTRWIVVIIPSCGERYLSTVMFADIAE